MAQKTRSRRFPRLQPVTPEEAKRLVDLVDGAINEFEGNIEHLEAAVGMLFVGRHMGWRPLVLFHNKRTIRRNEEILGNIDIRKYLPAETPRSERSLAYKIVKTVGNFWKAVSGDESVPNRRKLQK
jgi:hypothetical protein